MPKLLLSAAETPTAPLRHPPQLPEPLIIIYAGFITARLPIFFTL